MRCDYRSGSRNPEPLPMGKVYDADTGEHIPGCFFFDTETGEYGRHLLDENGAPCRDPENPRELATEWGRRRRLRFEPSGAWRPSKAEEDARVAEVRARLARAGIFPPWRGATKPLDIRAGPAQE